MAFSSITNFLRILKDNGFRFSPRYFHRILYVLSMNIFTGPMRILEKRLYQLRVERTPINQDPIFIIGHWRTGTTFLHYLMTQDNQWGFLSNYDTFTVTFSIVGRKIVKSLFRLGLPEKRPMDNIPVDLNLPQEEEFALGNLTSCSFCYVWYFPQRAETYFNRAVQFAGMGSEEIRLWKAAYLYLVKKTTLQWNMKTLLLKNPINTGRIEVLLKLFPNAKFIYLHRNPYEVFLSTVRTYRDLIGLMGFQKISLTQNSRNVLSFYPCLIGKFLSNKHRIPAGNIVYVSYEDLIRDPLHQLKRIYSGLSLPGYSSSLSIFQSYLETFRGYKAHQYTIDKHTKELVDTHWRQTYEKERLLG